MQGRFIQTLGALALLLVSGFLRAQAPETSSVLPTSGIHSERVQYAQVAGRAVYGYLSYPAAQAKARAGVILIHAWWGLDQRMQSVAEQLARQGYVVLAVDLFRGQTTRERPVAARLADVADADAGGRLSNLEQAVNYLNSVQHVRAVGVVGWSVGGRWAFRLTSDLPQAISALVTFYAPPYTEPSELAPLRMPILAFFGGRDPFVPAPVVAQFQWAAGLANTQADIHIYPDAQAGFDNPDSTAYNAVDATDAERQLTAFLALHLER